MSIRVLSYAHRISLAHCIAWTCWFKTNHTPFVNTEEQEYYIEFTKGYIQYFQGGFKHYIAENEMVIL